MGLLPTPKILLVSRLDPGFSFCVSPPLSFCIVRKPNAAHLFRNSLAHDEHNPHIKITNNLHLPTLIDA